MLDYWGGACAVTGLALPQALRASRAKPWAECVSDAERLEVFNGFLLSANLDVLFEGFLVSFSEAGALLVSKAITPSDQQKLGLAEGMSLRRISAQHRRYLDFHRHRFLQGHPSGVNSLRRIPLRLKAARYSGCRAWWGRAGLVGVSSFSRAFRLSRIRQLSQKNVSDFET